MRGGGVGRRKPTPHFLCDRGGLPAAVPSLLTLAGNRSPVPDLRGGATRRSDVRKADCPRPRAGSPHTETQRGPVTWTVPSCPHHGGGGGGAGVFCRMF